MRSWVLIIALPLLLAAGVWLFTDRDRDLTDGSTADARAPNVIITGLQRVTTDAAGQWQSSLVADQAHYFEAEDQLNLESPTLWTRSDTDYELTAERAELRDGSQWQLHSNVLITSSPGDAPPVAVRTQFLEYDTLTDVAETPAPVEIVQNDRFYTTAIGMTLNTATQEFVLHEQVRSLFYPEP